MDEGHELRFVPFVYLGSPMKVKKENIFLCDTCDLVRFSQRKTLICPKCKTAMALIGTQETVVGDGGV